MNMDSEYYVWRKGWGEPKVGHQSHDVAFAEAKRLAQENEGVEFFVLRVVKSVTYKPSPFVIHNYSTR